MVDASLHIECPKKTFRPLQKVDFNAKNYKKMTFFSISPRIRQFVCAKSPDMFFPQIWMPNRRNHKFRDKIFTVNAFLETSKNARLTVNFVNFGGGLPSNSNFLKTP